MTGRARGGGAEFLLALDLRYAALDHAWFGQPEVALGIFPGGGGTQLLPRLIGRSRALEVVLGARLYDARTAERYGWIDRALPADELDAFVDDLARRIAGHPPAAVAAAERAVLTASELPLTEGLAAELALLMPLFTGTDAVQRFSAALEAGATNSRRGARPGAIDRAHPLGRAAPRRIAPGTLARGGPNGGGPNGVRPSDAMPDRASGIFPVSRSWKYVPGGTISSIRSSTAGSSTTSAARR
ncbi:enoyl-CoA hydratase/isomerase family protein [Nocardia africana]|uniref:Enoyl-CoA hydratase/isomerase family protein n=1 Tax=Nocardia africana TaxID=134964 RepID=A0ABW6NH17_9NOCA